MEVEKLEEVRKVIRYKVKCSDCDATTIYDYEPMSPWTCAKCTMLKNLQDAEKTESIAKGLIGGTIVDIVVSGSYISEMVIEVDGQKYRMELWEWQGDVEYDVYEMEGE
jgi:hypothetical protein